VAQKTQVVLIDDLTGDVLPDGKGQTISFSLDGTSYEIDLSKENADSLRTDLKRYVDAGRRVGRAQSAGRRGGSGRAHPTTAAVRAWARQHGYPISERGRIPITVVEAYEAAN
jgi:hypothetical protein